MSTSQLTFGVKTSQINSTYAEILKIWREVDRNEAFDHAWLWDHMLPLREDVTQSALEAWTLLAALAAETERIRLGVVVTSNRLRPPAVLAKMAATVDQISAGRLVFGIGAGGHAVPDPAGMALVEREFGAYGIAVVSPREAVDALGEAMVIIRRLWTESAPFDFTGHHYQLKGAIGQPMPVQRPGPPVMMAGSGARSLRIAAEYADLWIWPGDLDEFRIKSRLLDEQCLVVGRDPAEITRSVQVLMRGGRVEARGTRELLHRFIEAGARHFVLGLIPPYDGSPVEWLAQEIVEKVLAQIDSRPVS
ncbi:MAG TPA: LLM class flavin-dependent oxidoreductase [Candidatus Micrarchaeaceae archaeon]|nr:LLM class flavin-dependent oxidoreductase [Candidatus Micrarchaeaceae archaeon]